MDRYLAVWTGADGPVADIEFRIDNGSARYYVRLFAAGVSFSSKEKLKSILIATNWRFYEFMLRTFAGYRKGWHRRCQNTNQCGFVKKRIKDAKS